MPSPNAKSEFGLDWLRVRWCSFLSGDGRSLVSLWLERPDDLAGALTPAWVIVGHSRPIQTLQPPRTRVGQYQSSIPLYPIFLSEESVWGLGYFSSLNNIPLIGGSMLWPTEFLIIPGTTPVPSLHPSAQPRPVSSLASFPSLLSHFLHIYSNLICLPKLLVSFVFFSFFQII